MVKRVVVRFPAGMPRIHVRAFATESSDEQDCDFGRQLAANVRTALVWLCVVKRLSRKLRNIPA